MFLVGIWTILYYAHSLLLNNGRVCRRFLFILPAKEPIDKSIRELVDKPIREPIRESCQNRFLWRIGGRKNKSDPQAPTDGPRGDEDGIKAVIDSLASGLKGVEAFVSAELDKINVHRASTGLVDGLVVETGEGNRKLRHIARIIVKNNFELTIEPFNEANLTAIFCTLSLKFAEYKILMGKGAISVVIPRAGSEIRRLSIESVRALQHGARGSLRVVRQNSLKDLGKIRDTLSDDKFFQQKAEMDSMVKRSSTLIDDACSRRIKFINDI